MSSFCKCKNYSQFFSKNISIYAIFNDQSFKARLTNDIISFEQLGPGLKGTSSIFRVYPFSEGRQKQADRIALPESISVFSIVVSTAFRKSFFAWRFIQEK